MVGINITESLDLQDETLAGRVLLPIPPGAHQMGPIPTDSIEAAEALRTEIEALGVTVDLDGAVIARAWWIGDPALAEQVASVATT